MNTFHMINLAERLRDAAEMVDNEDIGIDAYIIPISEIRDEIGDEVKEVSHEILKQDT